MSREGVGQKLPRVLIMSLVLAVLILSIVTAALRGWEASSAKQAELLYRRKKNMERELGELSAEVRKLKSPAELDARIEKMKGGGSGAKPASKPKVALSRN